MNLCLAYIAKWSVNVREFITIPTIRLPLWTLSYQWALESKNIVLQKHDDETVYYCPAGNDHRSLTNEEIQVVKLERWNTFDQFAKRAFRVWLVTLPNDGENWRNGSCTCPIFLKKFCCKHLVGLAIRLKLTKPPTAAKCIPIGHKRKRGRPKQATKALLIN